MIMTEENNKPIDFKGIDLHIVPRATIYNATDLPNDVMYQALGDNNLLGFIKKDIKQMLLNRIEKYEDGIKQQVKWFIIDAEKEVTNYIETDNLVMGLNWRKQEIRKINAKIQDLKELLESIE